MKKYIQLIIFCSAVIMVFGVFGPNLISSASTEKFCAGVILILVALPIMFKAVKKLITKDKVDEKN